MDARFLLITSAAVLFACAPGGDPPPSFDVADVFDGTAGRWVDLSHAFSDETLYWPTADGFTLREDAFGDTEGGYFYASYSLETAEHGGTHLDAPIHFAREGQTTDRIPLGRLIGSATVVDVSAQASPDYLVTVEDLSAWESSHGRIQDGTILLLRTGWGRRWPDRERYMGTDRTGPEAVAELHFPGLAPGAATWLVENRAIAAIGIDTPSIDFGQSTGFESHVILYGAGIPGFENVANLDALPESGAYVVALPMKIAGGSGGPLRIVGFVPN